MQPFFNLNVIVGALSIIISVVGIIGNLLTIVSFYYAKHKRRYRFYENWQTSNIYIVNLAIIDFGFCVCIQIQAFSAISFISYENGHRTYDDPDSLWCTFSTHLQLFFGCLDSSAIGLISLTRAIAVTNNKRWEIFCEKKRNVWIVILFPWILSTILYIPAFQVRLSRDLETGYCYPKLEELTTWYVKTIRLVVHGVMAITIIMSYSYIFFYISKHTRASKRSSLMLKNENSKLVHSRNIQIAKTMAIVSFSSIFLLIPWCVVQILHVINNIDPEAYTVWHVVTYAILILQYSVNIFIYVWRKDEYRRALTDVLFVILPKCLRKNRNQDLNMSDGIKSQVSVTQ